MFFWIFNKSCGEPIRFLAIMPVIIVTYLSVSLIFFISEIGTLHIWALFIAA